MVFYRTANFFLQHIHDFLGFQKIWNNSGLFLEVTTTWFESYQKQKIQTVVYKKLKYRKKMRENGSLKFRISL